MVYENNRNQTAMPKCPLKFTVIRENNVIDLEAIFLMIISLVVLDNNIRDLKQNRALTSRTITRAL